MRGLIIHEFSRMFTLIRLQIIIIAMGILFVFTTNDNTYLLSYSTLLVVLLPISSLRYDEMDNWEHLALTFPINREDLIHAKYFMLFSLFMLYWCLNVVAASFVSQDVLSSIQNMSFMAVGVFTFLSVQLAITYKFGSQKGSYVLMLMGIFIILSLSVFPGEITSIYLNLGEMMTGIFLLVAFLISGGCYLLIKRMYLKKQF